MHEFLQYVLVFVFAAIPWIEIAVVIPIALGLGIHPLFVAGLAFAGNLGSVLLLLKCMPWIPRLRTRSDNDRDSVEKKRRTAWGVVDLGSLWISRIGDCCTGCNGSSPGCTHGNRRRYGTDGYRPVDDDFDSGMDNLPRRWHANRSECPRYWMKHAEISVKRTSVC